MRALNFLLIISIALGLVAFSLQNTQPASIYLIPGDLEVEAPVAVELIVAAGFGGMLAWLSILWSRLQQLLGDRATFRKIRDQEKRIRELQDTLQQYQGQTLVAVAEAEAKSESQPATAEDAVEESVETKAPDNKKAESEGADPKINAEA